MKRTAARCTRCGFAGRPGPRWEITDDETLCPACVKETAFDWTPDLQWFVEEEGA